MTLNIKIALIFLSLLYSTTYAISGTNDVDALKETDCGEIGDCILPNNGCNNSIGFFYNETIDDCVINIKLLLQSLKTKYDTQDKIRLEVLSVFQGVIISVILFVTCASLCVMGACIYCCRINYTDYKLKKDVEALAAKLKRDFNLKKSIVKPPTQPISESCNVVVQSAGVYVV